MLLPARSTSCGRQRLRRSYRRAFYIG